MDISRSAVHLARHSGHHYGPEPTWRTASFGAKVASLAVLAVCGSLAAFASIPAMAIISAVWHAL
jgi:hypothetical protein